MHGGAVGSPRRRWDRSAGELGQVKVVEDLSAGDPWSVSNIEAADLEDVVHVEGDRVVVNGPLWTMDPGGE
jgi:hypothetical protein